MELFLPANTCPDSDAGSWERGGDAELVVARSRSTWGQSRVGGWRRRRGTWRPPGWCARPTEVGSTFKSSMSTSSKTSKCGWSSTHCPTPKWSEPSKFHLPQVFSISTSPSFPIPCIFGSIIWATTIESMITMQEQPQQSQTSIQVSLQCPSRPTPASPSCPQAPRWSTGPPCSLGEVVSKLTSEWPPCCLGRGSGKTGMQSPRIRWGWQ